MGQIADDIINGLQCESCGTCFTKEHGYPVTCKSCYKTLTPAQKKQVQVAIHPEF